MTSIPLKKLTSVGASGATNFTLQNAVDAVAGLIVVNNAGSSASGNAVWGGIVGTLSNQTDLQNALNAKAPLVSPSLTGTPTAPTAATATNTTQIATTAFVEQELTANALVINSNVFSGGTSGNPLNIIQIFNAQTASYTLALTDAGIGVSINNASANNLTVPLNSSVAFPIGTQILLTSLGAGQTTIVATGGVTINSAGGFLKLRVQYSTATLVKIATNTWLLSGDLA